MNTNTHNQSINQSINQTINLRSSEIEEYFEGEALELSLGDDGITVGPGGFDDGVDG